MLAAALFGPVAFGILCGVLDRHLRKHLSGTLLVVIGIVLFFVVAGSSSIMGAVIGTYLLYALPVAFVAYYLNR